jgi:hypothetical protein
MQLSYGYGNHVPEVFRDDVDRDEIDFAGGVAAIVTSALDDVMGVHETPGGLDLDSPELVAGIDDEIVTLTFSPRFGDAKTEAGGFGEKGGFSSLATRFARGEADGVKL